MYSEISFSSATSDNFPREHALANQDIEREGTSIEIPTSPRITVDIPSDNIAVAVLGLACLLVWLTK